MPIDATGRATEPCKLGCKSLLKAPKAKRHAPSPRPTITVETFRTKQDRGNSFQVAITGHLDAGRVRVEVLSKGFEGQVFTVARTSLISCGRRAIPVHAPCE